MTWSTAFTLQAQSDLAARDWLLQNRNLPQCHELHFLQMACEKLCKAHLMARPGVDPSRLQRSHAYIAKNLPLIARDVLSRHAQHVPTAGYLVAAIRCLAEQIERLAPANDAGGTAPSNCEYPWTGSDRDVVVPARHNFGISLLHERAGRTLIKVLRMAAAQLIE
jgi:hypothetical protein